MSDFGWNYPPGVTGNEPELTGEWPCGFCGGEGCWACKNGIHPEEAPACPECDSPETRFFSELEGDAQRLALTLEDRKYGSHVSPHDHGAVIVCFECGEVSK